MKMRLFLIAAIMLLVTGLNCLARVDYPVTVGNANSENVTKVFSTTVPVGEWGDVQIIDYLIVCRQKQSSGVPVPCVVQLRIQGKIFNASSSVMATNANTGVHFISGRLMRVGDEIYVAAKGSNSILSPPSSTDDFAGTPGSGAIIADVDFNADIEIAVYVDWGPGTDIMYNVIAGKLWKF